MRNSPTRPASTSGKHSAVIAETAQIRGGSIVAGQACVLDDAVLSRHSVVTQDARVSGSAQIARSRIEGSAVVEREAKVTEAYVGGRAHLTHEHIGKHGHIESPTHATYVRIDGIGYTIHRTFSDVKGFGAAITMDSGDRLSLVALRELASSSPMHRALLSLFMTLKRIYSNDPNNT